MSGKGPSFGKSGEQRGEEVVGPVVDVLARHLITHSAEALAPFFERHFDSLLDPLRHLVDVVGIDQQRIGEFVRRAGKFAENQYRTVALFQGFAIAGQVEQAQAAADAAEANLQVLHESVVLEVEQAYFNLKEAGDRLDATSKIVEQAEQNLLLAERQYAAGVGTALEASDARLSLSNARISRIQALFDYNSALVQLQKAMGVLGK